MANKEIINLPAVTELTGETLIPVYQPGAASRAQAMTGDQLKDFSRSGFRQEYQEAIDNVQAEGAVQVAIVIAASEATTSVDGGSFRDGFAWLDTDGGLFVDRPSDPPLDIDGGPFTADY